MLPLQWHWALRLACAACCACWLTAIACAQQRPIPVVLDDLERQVVSLEAGGSATQTITQLEADAQTVLTRAGLASERIRARRVLRKLSNLAETRQASPPARRNEIGLVNHEEPAAAKGNYQGLPPETQARLDRWRAGAARLAQLGAPQPTISDPCAVADPYAVGDPYSAVACPPQVMACPQPVVAVACSPPPTRHYLNLDALGWWVKGDSLPPLVTTSPIGTPQQTAGVLGQPTTTVLFGNQDVNTGLRWGGRAQGGVWLDDFQTFAVEGHYYGLATETTTFSRTSVFSDGTTDDPILARPFFDANPLVNAQSSVLVAFPDFVVPLLPPTIVDIDGSINIQEQSRIQSAGGGGRYALGAYNNPLRLFLLGAYRYFNLTESLSITADSTLGFEPLPFPDDGVIQAYDSVATENTFNGGEVGLGAELSRDRLSLGVESRLAMGNMHQRLTIDGRTSATYDTFVASYEGGLLAQPSNIGSYSRNVFALIPQVDVKLGVRVLPSLLLTVGYNFTYVTSVIRPGDQVDLNVNTTQIAGLPLVGPAVPAASFDATSMWLQGFTTGLDLRF